MELIRFSLWLISQHCWSWPPVFGPHRRWVVCSSLQLTFVYLVVICLNTTEICFTLGETDRLTKKRTENKSYPDIPIRHLMGPGENLRTSPASGECFDDRFIGKRWPGKYIWTLGWKDEGKSRRSSTMVSSRCRGLNQVSANSSLKPVLYMNPLCQITFLPKTPFNGWQPCLIY